MTKRVVQSRITEHRKIGGDTWKMSFSSPEIADQSAPGQFVHMCIPGKDQPFLRRPFSLANVNTATGLIDIIYRVVGDGTRRIAVLKEGDMIDCMGPLGVGFKISGQKPLLVGGGMGLAPLIYLAEALKTKNTEILMGGRNKEEMIWPEFYAQNCKKVHVTTDDGSMGTKGFTTDLLPKILDQGAFDSIYTCGPHQMMQNVASQARARGVSCQVSLEAHMACGVGACLSCVCDASDGTHRKICTDGPVFDAREIFK